MLPESKFSKQTYIEMRDCRTRCRQGQLAALKGNLDEFKNYILRGVAMDAEMAELRESTDFATLEGNILTDEMVHAIDSALAWGAELRRLILESGVAEL